jgi:hypothetical protein
MSDTEKKTRKKNPLTAYARAKAKADKVRRAHARAEELAEKAKAAAERAAELASQKDEAEKAEQAALAALQGELESIRGGDTDSVADADEE